MAKYLVENERPLYLDRIGLLDGISSNADLGIASIQDLLAQTIICYMNPNSDEFFYFISKVDAGSGAGMRFYYNGSSGAIFEGNSSGNSNAPNRIAIFGILTNYWQYIAATWDGTILGTGIKIYQAHGSETFTEPSYSSTGDGIGTPLSGAGKNLIVGSSALSNFSFSGSLAYIARWNRVLPKWEMIQVQRLGPLSAPQGLVLCWANGKDYSPANMRPITGGNNIIYTGAGAGIGPLNNNLGKFKYPIAFNKGAGAAGYLLVKN